MGEPAPLSQLYYIWWCKANTFCEIPKGTFPAPQAGWPRALPRPLDKAVYGILPRPPAAALYSMGVLPMTALKDLEK